jgi:hypothetical protein
MELEELADQYPGWHLWSSRRGEYVCATRRAQLTPQDMFNGVDRTLIRESLRDLATALSEMEAK